MSQVDIDGDTVALTAAVVETFMHRLRVAVLTGAHRVLIFVHLPLRVVAISRCSVTRKNDSF